MTPNVNTMQKGLLDTAPICVDLDGTLVNTDTLIESLFALLKHRPIAILLLPVWLLRGKAYLKARVAEFGEIDAQLLPFNEQLLNYLRSQKALGRTLVLATAANERIARRVADTLGLFDQVIASNDSINLSGDAKCKELILRYGERGFDYAGNDRVDVQVWKHARHAIVVNPASGIEDSARSVCTVIETLPRQGHRLGNYLKCLRVHQWAKNALLFIPLLTSHHLGDVPMVVAALAAFAAFSLCSSSVYILNDLLDLPSDRRHRSKRHRSLASGTVSIKAAMLLVPFLLMAGFGIAAYVNLNFVLLLATYYIATLCYSFQFKSVVVLDVLVLAALYVIRVIGGAEAIAVPLSFWLLAFSMFLFLSLALVKRCSELISMSDDPHAQPSGRGYRVSDLAYLQSMGTSSGYMAVLVLALYINSAEVLVLYTSPEALWLLCPIVLYWISYVWVRTGRGEMNDDPVLFAVKDRQSLFLGVLAVVAVAAALL